MEGYQIGVLIFAIVSTVLLVGEFILYAILGTKKKNNTNGIDDTNYTDNNQNENNSVENSQSGGYNYWW